MGLFKNDTVPNPEILKLEKLGLDGLLLGLKVQIKKLDLKFQKVNSSK